MNDKISRNIQFINLSEDLENIRKSAIHQTWDFKQSINGLIINGVIHEISFSEIMEILIKNYPQFYVLCNLEKGYIEIH